MAQIIISFINLCVGVKDLLRLNMSYKKVQIWFSYAIHREKKFLVNEMWNKVWVRNICRNFLVILNECLNRVIDRQQNLSQLAKYNI